jgi:hypothetical protein
MRYVLFICAALYPLICQAWQSPCHQTPVKPMAVPRQGHAQISLEASRVLSAQGNVMEYDLGKEIITIKVDNFLAKHFLKEVQNGACTNKCIVAFEPDKDSPFAARYKASMPLGR